MSGRNGLLLDHQAVNQQRLKEVDTIAVGGEGLQNASIPRYAQNCSMMMELSNGEVCRRELRPGVQVHRIARMMRIFGWRRGTSNIIFRRTGIRFALGTNGSGQSVNISTRITKKTVKRGLTSSHDTTPCTSTTSTCLLTNNSSEICHCAPDRKGKEEGRKAGHSNGFWQGNRIHRLDNDRPWLGSPRGQTQASAVVNPDDIHGSDAAQSNVGNIRRVLSSSLWKVWITLENIQA